MKADVIPSQRVNATPHVPWVAQSKKQGTVFFAHCSMLMHGGFRRNLLSCRRSSVKIEVAVRTEYTKTACTNEACQKNINSVKKVELAEIGNIEFCSAAVVERYRQNKGKRHDIEFTATGNDSEAE